VKINITYERGDTLRIAARPAFEGRVTEVGTEFITVQPSGNEKDQIVRITDIDSVRHSLSGSEPVPADVERALKVLRAFDASPAREEKRAPNPEGQGQYRYRGTYYNPSDDSSVDWMHHHLRLSTPNFDRAVRYFTGLLHTHSELGGCQLRSVALWDEGWAGK